MGQVQPCCAGARQPLPDPKVVKRPPITKQPDTAPPSVFAEPPKAPASLAEKLAAKKKALADGAASLKDKANAKIKEKTGAKGDDTLAVVADSRTSETMQVSQDFATWLVGKAKKRDAKERDAKGADDAHQTVMKTIAKSSGAELNFDHAPPVLKQKKLHIIGTKEERDKAKQMLQDVSSRCKPDSLEGFIDDWGERGGGGCLGYEGGKQSFESINMSHKSIEREDEGAWVEGGKREKEPMVSVSALRRNMMTALDVAKKRAVEAPKPPEPEIEAEAPEEFQGGTCLVSGETAKKTNQVYFDLVEGLQDARKQKKVDSADGTYIKTVRDIVNKLVDLPVSPFGMKASGITAELNSDLVQQHPDPAVKAKVDNLLEVWKECLSYAPESQFNDALDVFLATSTHGVQHAVLPALWREDRHGGADLSLSKEPEGTPVNEAERTRLCAALKSLAPHITAVQPRDPDFIMFRVEKSKEFCSHMAADRHKAMPGEKEGEEKVPIAVLRDRGPNNYIRVRVGKEDDNNRFVAGLVAALGFEPD